MFYTVDMDVEIDVQDAFDNLGQDEKVGFINYNIDHASDDGLIDEINRRNINIKDLCYHKIVEEMSDEFLTGGMTAHDFLCDCLCLQHSVSVDEIIDKIKSVLL